MLAALAAPDLEAPEAGAAVEVPTLVDANGLQPTTVNDIPPQLVALMRTNVNVQELTVAALMEENREHVYHAAMLDPHTAAELDLRQIRQLVDDLIAAHGDLPKLMLLGPLTVRVAPTGTPTAAVDRKPYFSELLAFLANQFALHLLDVAAQKVEQVVLRVLVLA